MAKFLNNKGEELEISSKKMVIRRDLIIHLDLDGNEILNGDGTPMKLAPRSGGFKNITVLAPSEDRKARHHEYFKNRSKEFIKKNQELKHKGN